MWGEPGRPADRTENAATVAELAELQLRSRMHRRTGPSRIGGAGPHSSESTIKFFPHQSLRHRYRMEVVFNRSRACPIAHGASISQRRQIAEL